MADETTQPGADEANDELHEEPTGQAEANIEESGEPNADPKESELTPDQIQGLLQTQKRYKDLEGEFTRRSQELAEQRRMNEQYQEALKGFMGQQQAAQDPVAAARQRWIQAKQSYDPDAEAEALDAYMAAREGTVRQQAAREALTAFQLQNAVESTKKYGINDAQELARLRQQMTQADEVEALALYKLQKEGKLEDYLNKAAQERRTRAERAQRLNALAGEGAGGSVPGSLGGNQDKPPVNPLHWFAMSDSARRKKYGDIQPTNE